LPRLAARVAGATGSYLGLEHRAVAQRQVPSPPVGEGQGEGGPPHQPSRSNPRWLIALQSFPSALTETPVSPTLDQS
jgi:hypothetical protein